MNELLKALAENDREREAPAAAEDRLKLAFRKKYAPRRWPYFAVAAAVAIALAIIAIPKRQTTKVRVTAPPVVVPAIQMKEVVTRFYPLMEYEPFERGELLRVRLPAAAMREVGLPVSEEHLDDPVVADILVGEEGLARAIRFVTYER